MLVGARTAHPRSATGIKILRARAPQVWRRAPGSRGEPKRAAKHRRPPTGPDGAPGRVKHAEVHTGGPR
ncbi:hypothetical protein AGIG_G3663 [Arapaima gigas]